MSTMIIANPVANASGYSHQALSLDLSPKTRRPQTCRFDNTVFVVEIPSARTYSAAERQLCWYNSQDYRDFRVSMILERAGTSISHQRKPKKMNSESQNNTVCDASPSLPQRSSSPDPGKTRKALPKDLPLYTDDDDCDDESSEACAMDVDEEEDETIEYQTLKIKTMRAKIRRLREKQQERKTQSSTSENSRPSPPYQSFQNRYEERQSIDRTNALDTSVRQYIPFPEDDDLETKTTRIPTTNVLPPKYEFEHPLFNLSAYSSQTVNEAAEAII